MLEFIKKNSERCREQSPCSAIELDELEAKLEKMEKELYDMLTREQIEMYEDVSEVYFELMNFYIEDSYIEGFREALAVMRSFKEESNVDKVNKTEDKNQKGKDLQAKSVKKL